MSKDKICTLVFLRRKDELLLAMKKRGFGTGHWNGAGGKIEPGETVEQAMVREAQEEINVTPTKWNKVAEHDFLMDVDTKKPWHIYVHAFIASEWLGEPSESEEMAPKWFDIADIPYEDMWQDDPFWIPEVLKGNLVVGKYEFDQNNQLQNHRVDIVKNLPGKIPEGS